MTGLKHEWAYHRTDSGQEFEVCTVCRDATREVGTDNVTGPAECSGVDDKHKRVSDYISAKVYDGVSWTPPTDEQWRALGYRVGAEKVRLSDAAWIAFKAWVRKDGSEPPWYMRWATVDTAASWDRVAAAVAQPHIEQAAEMLASQVQQTRDWMEAASKESARRFIAEAALKEALDKVAGLEQGRAADRFELDHNRKDRS